MIAATAEESRTVNCKNMGKGSVLTGRQFSYDLTYSLNV